MLIFNYFCVSIFIFTALSSMIEMILFPAPSLTVASLLFYSFRHLPIFPIFQTSLCSRGFWTQSTPLSPSCHPSYPSVTPQLPSVTPHLPPVTPLSPPCHPSPTPSCHPPCCMCVTGGWYGVLWFQNPLAILLPLSVIIKKKLLCFVILSWEIYYYYSVTMIGSCN